MTSTNESAWHLAVECANRDEAASGYSLDYRKRCEWICRTSRGIMPEDVARVTSEIEQSVATEHVRRVMLLAETYYAAIVERGKR